MLNPSSMAIRIATIAAIGAAQQLARFNLTPDPEYVTELDRLKGLLDDPGVTITLNALNDARYVELSFRLMLLEHMATSDYLNVNDAVIRTKEIIMSGNMPVDSDVRYAMHFCRDTVRCFDSYQKEASIISDLCEKLAKHCDSNARLDMERYTRYSDALKDVLVAMETANGLVDKKYEDYKSVYHSVKAYHDKYVLK